MHAPFYKFDMFTEQFSFILAFVIGIAFGFVLERAGFGNSRKLSAEFYFRDMSVLKVMFMAIITAMTGLYFLSRIGFVDLSMVYLVPTFVIPQLVGGLLLGIGFVIGGYCPGTSCVATATGRIDGLFYVLGGLAGLAGFAEIYPSLQGFLHMTSMGQITLAKLFNVPYGLLVFAVVVIAIGAFLAAEWAESKVGGVVQDPGGSLLKGGRKLTPVRAIVLVIFAGGLMAAFAGNPYRTNTVSVNAHDLALSAGTNANQLTAAQVANGILQDRNDYQLIDLRSTAAYAKYHIPTAQNVPLATLGIDVAPRTEPLLLISDDGTDEARAWFILSALGFKSVYLLQGGMPSWDSQVLHPVHMASMDQATTDRLAMIARFFGGSMQEAAAGGASTAPAFATPAPPQAPPVAAPALSAPGGAPARKMKEGC